MLAAAKKESRKKSPEKGESPEHHPRVKKRKREVFILQIPRSLFSVCVAVWLLPTQYMNHTQVKMMKTLILFAGAVFATQLLDKHGLNHPLLVTRKSSVNTTSQPVLHAATTSRRSSTNNSLDRPVLHATHATSTPPLLVSTGRHLLATAGSFQHARVEGSLLLLLTCNTCNST